MIYAQGYSCGIICDNKTLEKSKSSSLGDWLNKLWYIHTVEHYAAVKRNVEGTLQRNGLWDMLLGEKHKV